MTTNVIFSVVFTLECIVKITGLGFIEYLRTWFNFFDFVVVISSLMELTNLTGESGGLQILRAFRVLRIFKLIRGLPDLQMLVQQIFAAISQSYNLGLLIILFMAINAIVGKQIFTKPTRDINGELTRLNF